MNVETRWRRWIGLPGHEPTASVIGVSISLVVDRGDVHQYRVTAFRLQSSEGDATGGEHPAANREKIRLLVISLASKKERSDFGETKKRSLTFSLSVKNYGRESSESTVGSLVLARA